MDSGEKRTRESGPVHIEHIMPLTLGPEWKSLLDERLSEHGDYVDRWGNLTLLGGSKNIRASNNPFPQKRQEYAKSKIEMTRQLAARERWGLDEIDKRQAELAASAERIWNVAE